MLRRPFLYLIVLALCFGALLILTPWSQDVISTAPEQAARLTTWMSYEDEQTTYEEKKTSYAPVENHAGLNWTKVATIIETRDSPMLIPILQSWLSNVPNDWPFVVWTGLENHEILAQASSLQSEIKSGRLNLTRIDLPGTMYQPDPALTSTLSDFLANTNWFWRQFHPEAEWMVFFQTDAVLCSKSGQTVDDWIGYDFIGGPAPWSHGPGMDRLGGNGGLSMRRISSILNITTDMPRLPGQNPEDVWFTRRLKERPDTRWPEYEGRPTYQFSMSQGWMEDETVDEAWRPLGLHHGSGPLGDVLEPGRDGGMTNKMHRILEACPDFLYLRYALDERREVDWSEFNSTVTEGEDQSTSADATPSAVMSASETSASISEAPEVDPSSSIMAASIPASNETST